MDFASPKERGQEISERVGGTGRGRSSRTKSGFLRLAVPPREQGVTVLMLSERKSKKDKTIDVLKKRRTALLCRRGRVVDCKASYSWAGPHEVGARGGEKRETSRLRKKASFSKYKSWAR